MAYPLFNAFLPQYLEHGGDSTSSSTSSTPADVVSAETVYRNYMIQSLVGVPGSFIAYYTVDMPQFGRKGTMAISTAITGFSLFLFTLSNNPAWQTFASAIQNFFSNIMYGIIYAYTAEVFPAPVRGTGSGIASLLNRIAGICAPIVAAQAGQISQSAPILAAGALYVVAFAAMCMLTIETRGAQTL
jgi:MFS family permease